jgi:CheY-like chemotaxis protein
VLIAEDSTTLQKLYVYNFSREGIEPVIANNGREAVELASSRPFDVMLLDVLMPEVSGDEALRVMRRRGIRTPAFMVTANVLPSQRDEYLRAGANAVLRKPWTFSAIREAIIDALAAPQDFGDRDGGVSRQSSGTGSASGRKHSSSRSISGRSVGTAGGSVAGTGSSGTVTGTPGGGSASRARGHVPSSAGSVASRSSKASKGSAGDDTARSRHSRRDTRDVEATGPLATFRT